MLILKYILGTYIIIFTSVIFHEFGHYIGVKITGIKNFKIILGTGLWLIKSKYIYISIFVFSGCTEIPVVEIENKSRIKMMIIFMLGPIISLTIFGLSFLYHNHMFKLISVIYNGTAFIISLLPLGDTDMNVMLKQLKA